MTTKPSVEQSACVGLASTSVCRPKGRHMRFCAQGRTRTTNTDSFSTKITFWAALASLTIWLGSVRPANAQWQSQSLLIKPGWTAVYLHVDPSYTNLDYLVGSDSNNPITEVWLWMPAASVIQFVTSPAAPIT